MEFTEQRTDETPSLEELKKSAGRMSNWRERLKAVEELSKMADPAVIALLARIAKSDTVYQVQEAAHRKLVELGEEGEAPVRKKGELIKGTAKILLRIKKSLPEGHTYQQFKDKLQHMRTDVYDTYEGDKEAGFDAWLENTWSSLSAR
ncbi:HEAT repeat domain-containing protein [Paenibacillus sp. R14(2021)]|uniref:HEAT repeat domain-containing protein n=1 Tax=Paenibacillus sp. R14(2021) TaxID=2859228 RepID=UPI001C615909|nr:HEAT repeat domain-containing protein [Paenibacillus sp. R14(2021)]